VRPAWLRAGRPLSRNRTPLWIVHRDERLRAALRRLAGASDDALLGAPDDHAFRDAPSPGVVLLGLAGDFEAELEFAHRLSQRLPAARWLLLVDPRDQREAERLFDGLAADWLGFPPTAIELRQKLRETAGRRGQDELSKRKLRDALALRFARTFADLELPEILRAVDPRLADVPLLILGEPGTGRGLLARYVHVFGGQGGAWVEIDGRAVAGASELRHALASADLASELRATGGATVCVRDVDALPAPAQFALRTWIELGPPGPLARARRVRWMATAGDEVIGRRAPGLAPELAETLAGLAQRLPALRERAPEAILRFAADTIHDWCRAHGDRGRTLAPDAQQALVDHPWPGNYRELESVLARTLAGESGEPIRADQLRFELGPPLVTPEEQARELERFRSGGGGGETPRGESAARAPIAPRTQEVEIQAAPRGEGPREASAAPSPSPAAAPAPPPAAAAPVEPKEPAAPPTDPAAEIATYRRLAQSLAHELRNRLVSVRTFAELLPERGTDRAFHAELGPTVGTDVRRIDRLLERLATFADLPRAAAREPVDVVAILEEQLEALRPEIEARRLLVLKELDRTQAPAIGDRTAFAFAFEALLTRALAWVPERGDLYLASKAIAQGLRGAPTIRVVLRFHRPGERRRTTGPGAPPSDRELALDVVLAELAIRAQRGSLRIDATDAEETVIAVDLPAI
jgi:DNA-binding NtrC family response regulator